MYSNGVSHLSVNDELKGVLAILTWLGYIPRHKGADLPVLINPVDPSVERHIEFTPTRTPYDPRHMIAEQLGEQFIRCPYAESSFRNLD